MPRRPVKKKLKLAKRAPARPPAASPKRRTEARRRSQTSPAIAAPHAPEPELEAAAPSDRSDCHLVGIGTSAGGLEALELFLRNTPSKTGAAYIVVQHLDPAHKGMLSELLQRFTEMPVHLAEDGMAVAPDHCYVIPSNWDMAVLRGRLQLLPQTSPRGLNLPIDFFFRTLAEDQQERAIAVVLSGMGSDGTLGLRAIKERGGATFVQALGSARFDGMPRSAIDAGVADVVAPAEELTRRILAYRKHTPYLAEPAANPEDRNGNALDKIFVLLRTQTGNDFSLYKTSTIYRRIERRMGRHQIENVEHYVRFLRENPREIEVLFKELLIGVTNFFRDAAIWNYLKQDVLPELLEARPNGSTLRAWVPGCSSGDEAYSLAMVFKEALDALQPIKNLALKIFATDLDREAIGRARVGIYPESIAADVSPERLRRFFIQEERGYRIGKDIREMVVFAPQNVIMDPPFTKLDLLFCRNLLIYLSSQLQKKLIPLFHYSLRPGGLLLLGSAETVGSFTNLFAPVDAKMRLYRRMEQPAVAESFEFPSAFHSESESSSEVETEQIRTATQTPAQLERAVERVLVQRYSPLGVLCTVKGEILYVSGRAGEYFEPTVGKANLNVFAMARSGLRSQLTDAFSTAVHGDRPVKVQGIQVGTNGGSRSIDLTVQRLSEPKELQGTVLIVIADVDDARRSPKRPPPPRRRTGQPTRIAELERELEQAQDDVQTARGEMQSSQEELKSTNEELQSANEELQSSNEELTTSKEEMQSLNEELQTVNHELQSKVDELSRSNNDMKNLLNSTDIATLFLDGELRVRRYTTPTTKIIKLIPGDAGRPITDIASDLDYGGLADDAREVLRTLVYKERQSAARDGRWFTVRIMPYRTLENVIDGVVITFTDSTTAHALEKSLREQAVQLRQLAESLPALVWTCRRDGSCDYVSPRWIEYTGVSDGELRGYGWIDHVHPDERERVREEWRAVVKAGVNFNSEFRIRGADGSYRWFQTRAVAIRESDDTISKWYGTNTDVDDLKRAT
jgi:two-component system, chemotaxis family, CheB/CheR fusion protein